MGLREQHANFSCWRRHCLSRRCSETRPLASNLTKSIIRSGTVLRKDIPGNGVRVDSPRTICINFC